MLLCDAPGNQFLRLITAVFPVKALGETVFDFARVGERGIAVEANEIGEVVYLR